MKSETVQGEKGAMQAVREEADLQQVAQALLNDPAHADNPLRPVLAALSVRNEELHQRMERVLHISDGYHSVTRAQNADLIREYDRQIVRLEKLVRISDRYQSQLLQLNEELRTLSLRDPLTGAGNRRFMSERLREEAERARRIGANFSLALLDIDRFKSINDLHGHDVGDEVLCRVSDSVRAGLRDYDVFARWGGEEFLIALPESDLDSATLVCERVRAAISALRVSQGDSEIAVTVSMGLTEYRVGEMTAETIGRADVALRRAKAMGRDRLERA